MTLALLLAAAFVEPPFVHTAFKLWNRFVVDGQRVIMPVDGQLYEYTRAGRKLIAPGVRRSRWK